MPPISLGIAQRYLVRRHVPGPKESLLSQRSSSWVSTLAGLVLGGLGAAFVARAIVRDWAEIMAAMATADPLWLLIGLVLGLASMTGIGLGWKRSLTLMGVQSTVGPALAWYFVGQLGKYIPGGIWPVVGRGEMATRSGAARARTYGAVFLSLGATYLAATVMVVALLPLDPAIADETPAALWILALLPLGLGVAHPLALERILAAARRISGRDLRLDVPPWGASLKLVAMHLPSWLGIGCATWCVAVALQPGVPFVNVAVAMVLAWIAGFLAVPVPGGIGVREAVFILAATSLAGGMAATVAVISRFLFMVVDVTGAGLSLAVAPPGGTVSGISRPSPEGPPSARPSDS